MILQSVNRAGRTSVLDDLGSILHNHAVSPTHLRYIAVAFLACWALGPAMGVAMALHELEHHHSSADVVALAGMTQVLLHGHVHENGAGDHTHSAVPPSLMPSDLSSESQAGAVATTGVVEPPVTIDCAWQSGPPPDPTSRGPSSPSSLCVLRL